MRNKAFSSDKEFFSNYYNTFQKLVQLDNLLLKKLEKVKKELENTVKRGNKVIIVGNGGSAAIASHFCIDLNKNTPISGQNFNESSLITCFANDFGYEKWVEKAVGVYGKPGDVFIAISSSGKSPNIINGCKKAKELGFSKIITLSGFSPDNPLRKLGDIDLWIDSDNYNHIENIHQFWLLSIAENLIQKYSQRQEKSETKCLKNF